jgi:hypothetical protein
MAMMTIGMNSACSQSVGWQAGVAKADITPTEPLWMAGYGGRDKPAEGTLHPLWVKALALQDGQGRRAVVVTTDLLGLPRNISKPICERLAQQLGLEREAIMLTSSHTHCGPVLRKGLVDIYPLDENQWANVDRYSTDLENKIVETVTAAFGNLSPAQLAAGQGHTTFAINRRNNTEADVPKMKSFKGPIDHSVPTLRVTTSDGKLMAALFGYACHNTTLDFYQWCGDYAGFAQIAFEKANPGAVGMFYMGCGADQNPLPRRKVELAEHYGGMLAGAVQAVVDGQMRMVAPTLETVYDEITLELADAPTKEYLTEQAEKGNAYMKRWGTRLLGKLERGEPLMKTYPYPVQIWRLGGEQLWVALGGEVVVDYALRIKAGLGDQVWVTGYANDVMAYIPSLRVLNEGGYEGHTSQMVYGLPAKWDESVEEQVMSAVHRLAP